MPRRTGDSELSDAGFKEKREQLKLTHEEMAKWLGLSKRSITNYEQGITPVPWIVDLAISQEIYIRELLERKE